MWVGLIAVLLTLPAMWAGLAIDDYHVRLLMQGSNSPVRLLDSPWDLFRFFRDEAHLRSLIDYGFAPWWTHPQLRAGFWRPLACLTHRLDYALWPDLTALMHLHSILWYGLAVGLVAVLYRRLMGCTLAAGLAGLLYALDDAHGTVVGFLSNRSDLPAVVFAALCLMAHDRWRRDRWTPGAVLSPALLLVSLLCKEAGLATCAFLAAYELCCRDDRPRRRVLALLPAAVVVVGWRIVWSALGYGVANMGLYVDPLGSPMRFAGELLWRGPVVLFGSLGLPGTEAVAYVAMHHPIVPVVITAGLITLFWLGLPMFRRDRLARFWGVALLLAALPACTALPMDRMLGFTGIAGMALIARYLTGAGRTTSASTIQAADAAPKSRVWSRRTHRILAGLLIGVHGVLAPALLPLRSVWPTGPAMLLNQARLTAPMPAEIAAQTLILANPPETLLLLEAPLVWADAGQPLPRHIRILTSSAFQPVELHRLDAFSLQVRPAAGFLAGLADGLFRSPARPYAPGDRIELPGLTIEIAALTDDHRPAEAIFHFDRPLDDPSFYWLAWQAGTFVPFTPPAIGQTTTLPGADLD